MFQMQINFGASVFKSTSTACFQNFTNRISNRPSFFKSTITDVFRILQIEDHKSMFSEFYKSRTTNRIRNRNQSSKTNRIEIIQSLGKHWSGPRFHRKQERVFLCMA